MFNCVVLQLPLTAAPPEPDDSSKQGVSMSATPVYSELWFILLFALLGLFLLAILLGLVLQRYSILTQHAEHNNALNHSQEQKVMNDFFFLSPSQSPEEESVSQRAPSAGHASEDEEGWGRNVHGERSGETSGGVHFELVERGKVREAERKRS